MAGRSDYYWAYTALGSNAGQAVRHLITHPVSSLQVLITPRVKLFTMLWLFGAFCFLPLLSPISLAVIPLLLERMLGSMFPNWWVTGFQYNAFLVVVLVCAAVDGAAQQHGVGARAVSVARHHDGLARVRVAGGHQVVHDLGSRPWLIAKHHQHRIQLAAGIARLHGLHAQSQRTR